MLVAHFYIYYVLHTYGFCSKEKKKGRKTSKEVVRNKSMQRKGKRESKKKVHFEMSMV